MLLKRGDLTYRHYISDGKKFLYAKILKNNNESIRELIVQNGHLLPLEQQNNAIELLYHIDVWCTLWEELNSCEKFAIDDAFFFDNSDVFPKQAVESIVQYHVLLNCEE